MTGGETMSGPDWVLVPRVLMKVTIADAIWRLDMGAHTEARMSMVLAQEILSNPNGASADELEND